MLRAPMGDMAYWDEYVEYRDESLKKHWHILDQISANPAYDPQFTFDLAINHLRASLTHYSRGDSITELPQYFSGLLNAWELSNKLSDEICKEHNLKTCRDWTFELSDLNHYNWCFWLVGLGLSLKIPDGQWDRLLKLIGIQGQDIILDRIIASRSPEWTIGTVVVHKKPYARLLKAIDAPKEKQAILLKEFVEHWYVDLKRNGKQELWWYIYGDPEKHPLSMGSYFGRWCIEAVAAVKAFGLDDMLCLGHEHYPGDLLHPDTSTTHGRCDDVSSVVTKIDDFEPATIKVGLLSKLFGKR